MITIELYISNNETNKRIARQSVVSKIDIQSKRAVIQTLKTFFHNVLEAINKFSDEDYRKGLF